MNCIKLRCFRSLHQGPAQEKLAPSTGAWPPEPRSQPPNAITPLDPLMELLKLKKLRQLIEFFKKIPINPD